MTHLVYDSPQMRFGIIKEKVRTLENSMNDPAFEALIFGESVMSGYVGYPAPTRHETLTDRFSMSDLRCS